MFTCLFALQTIWGLELRQGRSYKRKISLFPKTTRPRFSFFVFARYLLAKTKLYSAARIICGAVQNSPEEDSSFRWLTWQIFHLLKIHRCNWLNRKTWLALVETFLHPVLLHVKKFDSGIRRKRIIKRGWGCPFLGWYKTSLQRRLQTRELTFKLTEFTLSLVSTTSPITC